MKILAIDTTESTAAVAVCEDERLLGEFHLYQTRTHSESILPMIRSLMDQLHLTVDEIDLFALSAGPGSFTGVRIGAATVKGLCFGRKTPCVAVSALEAMAYAHEGFEGLVVPVMDARRSQLYSATFRLREGRVERLTPDRVILIPDLIAELKQAGGTLPIRFCGGGEALVRQKAEGLSIASMPAPLRYENAWGVARLAYQRYLADPSCAVSDIELAPTYLRASQAERERLERKQIQESSHIEEKGETK